MSQLARRSIPEQYGRLVSLSLPCEGVSLAGFLAQAKGQPRVYWESQRDHVTFAGFGAALELFAYGETRFTQIQRQARELFTDAVVLDETEPLAAPRLFGGFAFRDDFVPDDAWSDFPPAHFVLPHYQLTSVEGRKWLTINAHIGLEDDPAELGEALTAALQARIAALQAAEGRAQTTAPPPPRDYNMPMPYDAWETMLNAAIGRIRSGELKKVVLSRVAEARYDQPVSVDAALKYLAEHYAESYRFLFEPRPYRAFYGATPELLVQVDGHRVVTMGLAGSIRRGSSPHEDEAMAAELLASAKDRHEHALVVERIKARLTPLTSQLTIGETGVMRLSNIQHLHTPIEGRLHSSQGVLPVVDALHPTPALGGEPKEIALPLIGQLEPITRGWFGAPVGWMDRHLDGQFAVAIRSAVAQKDRVWMYAGAGIVADSDPQKEWDETALKFAPMKNALGIS